MQSFETSKHAKVDRHHFINTNVFTLPPHFSYCVTDPDRKSWNLLMILNIHRLKRLTKFIELWSHKNYDTCINLIGIEYSSLRLLMKVSRSGIDIRLVFFSMYIARHDNVSDCSSLYLVNRYVLSFSYTGLSSFWDDQRNKNKWIVEISMW